MTDQWTEDRKHKGPFPFTARKVAQALTNSIDTLGGPFMSATIAEDDQPAVLIDALDITDGTYSKSFIVTVRDVDDERPEDKLERIRAYAELMLTTADQYPRTYPMRHHIAQDILALLKAS